MSSERRGERDETAGGRARRPAKNTALIALRFARSFTRIRALFRIYSRHSKTVARPIEILREPALGRSTVRFTRTVIRCWHQPASDAQRVVRPRERGRGGRYLAPADGGCGPPSQSNADARRHVPRHAGLERSRVRVPKRRCLWRGVLHLWSAMLRRRLLPGHLLRRGALLSDREYSLRQHGLLQTE